MNKVFVYGSLMYGQPNHNLLCGAEYFGKATSCERYHIMSMGSFPAVVTDHSKSNWKIDGEIYCCDDQIFERLDILECNGWLYIRRMRPFEVTMDKKRFIQHAWIYELFHENRSNLTPENSANFLVYENQTVFWNPAISF